MPVIPEARRYTVEEVLAFPADGNRYEVVAGELLVSPAPRSRHQLLVGRLFRFPDQYLRSLGLRDAVFLAPADITWGLPPKQADDLVQPDVFVPDPDQRYGEWVDMARLELAAEVVSLSSTRADRVVKRLTYQRHRVRTYWVVDDDARLVEVWRPDDDRPEIVTESLRWCFRDAETELQIPLTELFA